MKLSNGGAVRMMRVRNNFLLILPFLFITSVCAQERIHSFESAIEIKSDGSMIVTETIHVKSEGKAIRHGIYRDFPTYYVNHFGLLRLVGFHVKSVSRDDNFESWDEKKIDKGVRVYIGSANRYLKPGDYTYRIRYETTHQIGYFEDHDELYWNVTGNGWAFPIDNAKATVTLPEVVTASNISMEGYTGEMGYTHRDYTSSVKDSSASIQSTRLLRRQEGLTLVMTWPKGVLPEPTEMQRLSYFIHDNSALLIALFTLLVTFIYQFRAWLKAGRDPKPGVIFPHYDPPQGYSPAAARYISEMGYDNKVLTAAIINMAVKGYLSITKQNGSYLLTKKVSAEVLAPGEKVLLNELFSRHAELRLENWNHDVLTKAKNEHESALKRDYLNIYFAHNSGRIWVSVLGAVVMFILTLVTGSITGSSVYPVYLAPFAIIILMSVVFIIIMKAPSKKGRELMDKLDGFKMYLKVAEKDDLNLRNPPDKTPELFERYLPFAIALNVEQAWAEKFSNVFAALHETNHDYYPVWYVGEFDYRHLAVFTLDVSSSFTSTISSASIDPTASSGSGGGGSSGGGGGGGGGGGW